MTFEVVTRESLAKSAAARYKQWTYMDGAYFKGWRQSGIRNTVHSESVYNEIVAANGDPDKIDEIVARHYPESLRPGQWTSETCTACDQPVSLCAQFFGGEYYDQICLKCAEEMVSAMKAAKEQVIR